MRNPLTLRFPSKGITENTPYGAVPSGFALNALNVRPFDTDEKRMRGGQRPGTSLYLPDAVQADTPIQRLIQGDTPIVPTGVSGGFSVALFSDQFNYPNGSLPTVSGVWAAAPGFGNLNVSSNAVFASAVAPFESAAQRGVGYRSAVEMGFSFRLVRGLQVFSNGARCRMELQDSNDGLAEPFYLEAFWTAGDTLTFSAGFGPGSTTETLPWSFDANDLGESGTCFMRITDDDISLWVNGTVVGIVGGGSFGASRDLAVIRVQENADVTTPTSGTRMLSAYASGAGFGISTRETYLIAVAGGDIYQSDSPPTAMTLATGGTDALDSTTFLMGAATASPSPLDSPPTNIQRHIYFADGVQYKRLNIETNTVSTWAAVNGTLPADSDGNVCRIVSLYRGRVVMSGLVNEPGNWFMSKQNDPLDWDYSPATQTVTQAVAGNNTDAGLVADRINALVPYGDNTLIFGGDKTIWRLTGDPADGGTIDNVSYDVGIVGPDAWTRDPNGMMYFFGSNGVYAMPPQGGVPTLLSAGKLDKTFSEIDLTLTRVLLAWNRDRYGMHIILTPFNEPTSATTSYWYDQRTDSFWPEQYPTSNGPTAVVTFDGDAPDDRDLILGGWDGYLRTLDDAVTSDSDGESTAAINSFVDLGPFVGQFGRRLELRGVQTTLGRNSAGATVKVYAGVDPEQAGESGTVRVSRTLLGGLNKWVHNPVSSGALRLRFENANADESWSFEQTVITVGDGGMQKQGAR